MTPELALPGGTGRGWAPARQSLRALLARHADLGLSAAGLDTLVARVEFGCWQVGQEVASSDEQPGTLRVVVDGVLKVVCQGTGGAWTTVHLLGAGRVLYLAGAPGGAVRRVCAVAHTPTLVATLPPGAWRDVACHLRLDEIAALVACSWQSLSRRLYEKSVQLALPVRFRVLQELRSLAREFGSPHPGGVCIDLPLSHADLASLVGAARANVTRAVGALRADGQLAAAPGRFVLAAVAS